MAATTPLGCCSSLVRTATLAANRSQDPRVSRIYGAGLQSLPPGSLELSHRSPPGTSSHLLSTPTRPRSTTQLPPVPRTRHTSSASPVRAVAGSGGGGPSVSGDTGSFVELKKFLEDAKSVGRVRLIVNTGVGVLESVCTLEKLFYKAIPGKGEYANLINAEDNVDFHLLLDKVAKVRLARGKSMQGNISTYMLRFVDSSNAVGASIFVMWRPGTSGTYDPGQVVAFEELVTKYGEEVSFLAEGSEEASEL